jgi:hypothetical protein
MRPEMRPDLLAREETLKPVTPPRHVTDVTGYASKSPELRRLRQLRVKNSNFENDAKKRPDLLAAPSGDNEKGNWRKKRRNRRNRRNSGSFGRNRTRNRHVTGKGGLRLAFGW